MVAIANELPSSSPPRREERFFLGGAIVMALIVAAGFSTQLAMGRSSFAAPPIVHAHAIIFMGWVVIYLTQNILVTSGNVALHRRLGWIATGWVVLMLAAGCGVTAFDARAGHIPFFFKPLQFLVFDPLSLFAFAGLIFAGVALRKRTDWHRRLNFSAMALLLGAAFGRLLPMPLLAPWAWEATVAACATVLLVATALDARRLGRVHPAWLWGLAVLVAVVPVTEAITYSPVGLALYRTVAAGSKGATVAPLEFGRPPGAPPSAPAAGK
jgi:hypothetical protein